MELVTFNFTKLYLIYFTVSHSYCLTLKATHQPRKWEINKVKKCVPDQISVDIHI